MRRKLQSVQGNTARIIIRAFTRTMTTALDDEIYLLSIKHLFNRMIGEANLRLATSPSWNDIIQPRQRQSEGFSRKKVG